MYISVVVSVIKWAFYKVKYRKKLCVKIRHALRIHSVKMYISSDIKSLIKFCGTVGCRAYVVFNANGGEILVGDRVFINNGSRINSRLRVEIGDGTIIGENVLIYDHDHNFQVLGKMRDEFLCNEIKIGKNVWIGSGAIILRGSVIGDGAVIGAGTIIKGNIKENTLVYSKQVKEERMLIR